ncbi:MAG: hypothetical protein ACI4O8_08635 [Aristaeellaceae bacterium]
MKRISKLMALLLAIALVLSVAVPAIATEEKKEDISSGEYNELLEAALSQLPAIEEEPFESIVIYPTVPYTKAAGFKAPVVGTANVASTFALRSAMLLSDEEEAVDNGLEVSKVVSEPDANGQYTITLEAYATGSKITTSVSEAVPTDIILVLDQSGSMKNEDMKTIVKEDFIPFSNYTNAMYYSEEKDIYYKREDGSFVTVQVVRTESENGTYEPYSFSYYNSNAKGLYDASQNQKLYYKVGNNYYEITVKRSSEPYYEAYDAYYTNGNGEQITIFSNQWAYKSLSNTNNYYYYSGSYDYTYQTVITDEETSSTTVTPIAISNGDDNVPKVNDEEITLYYKQEADEVYISRLKALQNAATQFANSVVAKAQKDNVDHRIAVVGFANTNNDDYSNTEVFIGSKTYGYGTAAQQQYENAFQYMNTDNGAANVLASINALDANGGTYVDLGIEMANGIFKNNPVETGKRNRVVIVFTDGAPGYNGTWNNKPYGQSGDAGAVAAKAIQYAATTKNNYGATVYTIGIFQGADVTGTDNANTFMKNLSSGSGCYLTASNSDELDKIFETISNNIETGGSTTTLDSAAVVKDIIADSFKLPENANTNAIKVYTAEYTGENIFGNRNEFSGLVEFDESRTTISVSGFDFSENWVGTETTNGTVTTYRGKKLIIEIPVVPKPDFLGGNGVPTNGAASGVYESANATDAVENFNEPAVDVPVKTITPDVQDQNIYLTNAASLTDLVKDMGKYSVGQDTYTVDGTNNAYVNITYTIKDASGNVIATYTIPARTDAAGLAGINWALADNQNTAPELTDDETYTITCTVAPSKPKTDGVSDATGSNTAKVNVFKPEITFQDSVEDYLSTHTFPDYYTDKSETGGNNHVTTVWKHKSTNSNGEEVVETAGTGTDQVAVKGNPPELKLTYTVAGTDIKMVTDEVTGTTTGTIIAMQDIPVNVTVAVNKANPSVQGSTSLDITANTTFVHEKCDLQLDSPCTWISDWTPHAGNATKPEPESSESIPEFLIHVKNIVADLTIKKTGLDVYAYKDSDGKVTDEDRESAIITVKATGKDGSEVIYRFALANNQSVTIKDLKVGSSYTVAEENGWTWRYKAGSISKATGAEDVDFVIDKDPTKNQVTITNHADNPYWLGGDNYAVNVFGTTSDENAGSGNASETGN